MSLIDPRWTIPLFGPPPEPDPTIEGTKRSGTGTGSTVTISSFRVPAGMPDPILFLCVSTERDNATQNISSASWNGQALSAVVTHSVGSSIQGLVTIWHLRRPTTGVTSDLVVNFNSSAAFTWTAFVAPDLADAAAEDTEIGSGSGGTVSSTLVTVSADAFCLDAICEGTGVATHNPTSPQIEISDQAANGMGGAVSWMTGPTVPGNRVMEWTSSGTTRLIQCAAAFAVS